ncbi:hypothetical protein ES288_A02G192300v1 [Gossypium darwinii]|uniref:Uncharacterized protein n=2 Tax=Gossypium TaxID=3633 RepID=A0A5D2RLH2_GOSTO|nr:hypothetical protein ES288_A02G192300v1 [Gossypium darwinii]TYI40878.1 hypothetical protein ES332_A02G194500v1 [Gossypium tomentosum]
MSNSRQVLAEQWGGPKEFETNWSFDGQKSKRIEIDGRGGGDGDSTDRIMSCRTAWGSIIGSPPLIFRHLMSVSDSWSVPSGPFPIFLPDFSPLLLLFRC